jgi:peptidoglycan/LPS O-acetylase OafA/YrhL
VAVHISTPSIREAPASPRASSRIPELDGLRGMAISFVLLYHYFYFAPPANYHPTGRLSNVYVHLERFLAMGWSGVDLFFVLSGFLIGGILLDVRESPRYFQTFYMRRVFRIVPIYYAWIGLFAVVMLFRGQFPVRLIVTQFAFLQNVSVRYPYLLISTWFLPTWSLAVEEQFYLIAPLAIRLLSRRSLYWVLGAVICFAPLLRLWALDHLHSSNPLSLAYTLTPCRADALAMGILTALLWRNSVFRTWLVGHAGVLYITFAAFLAGFAYLGYRFPANDSRPMQTFGYSWIAMAYTLLLVLALGQSRGIVARIARISPLSEIGRVSYCLYIVHVAVFYGWMGVVHRIAPHLSPAVGVALNIGAAALAYGIARFSWRFFELPLLQRGHEFKY